MLCHHDRTKTRRPQFRTPYTIVLLKSTHIKMACILTFLYDLFLYIVRLDFDNNNFLQAINIAGRL